MSLEDAPDLWEVPTEEERPGYRLRSLSHATWAARKLRDLRRRRLDIHTTAQAEIDRIQAWAAREDEKLAPDIDWFRSLVEEFALTERRRSGGKVKSVSTPYGGVRTRVTSAPWTVTDKDALMAWLEKHRPDLVRRKPAPDPEFALGDAKKALTVQDGEVFDPQSGEPIPGLKVGEPGITATAEVDAAVLADEEDPE